MPALHATCSAGSVSLAVNSETLDPTPTGATTLVGRVLSDRYRIENVVNVGANTVIAEAIDIDANRPVTVKIVRPELAVTSAFGQAFRRQIEVAMSLTHPNIATVLGWGETELEGEPTLYWVVEYLGGGSLRDLFDRGRLLSPSQALVVGLEAARGLEAAHGRGIVHTELTPSKLVFGEDARLRITDFAMAQLLGAESWTEPATVATHVARYASPEQALGLDVDEKTDVYALSLCLIESITGTVPFAGDSTVSTLAARIGKLMPVTADMGSLASVLERGGRPDSDDRWTASEFGRALVSAAEALPRPEPIPVLASSLFASSLAHRVEPTPIEPTPIEPAPIEPTHVEPTHVEVDGDESSFDAVVPLVLLTDVSDPPTGAVEVAADPVAGDTVAADPDEADAVPAESASADETATVLTAAVATEAVAPTAQMPAVPLDPTPSGIIYDEEHPRRPWGKYILFGVIALVEEAVARNEVAGNGWVIETQRERSDEVPEIDHVVRTVPVAGERLDEGETFVIVVSDGFELRTLPELTGMTVSDAVDALVELRLVPIEAPAAFSEEVPAGSVIGWEVQDDAALTAGAQVLPDTVVVITPSLGPEPRPAPDLVNLTAAEATAALDALQLVTEQGKDVFSNDIEKGRVVTQTPDPGTPVERGGTVTFQLSKGPDLVPFPDLTGLAYPAARAALADAGYTVKSLLGTTEGTFVSASVGGDEIQAGATFPRGTGVDLIFL